MKILYLINELSIGGAEKGLAHLIENGFFGNCDLTVASLFRGNGMLLAELDARKINGGIHTLMPQQKMSIIKLIMAFFKLLVLLKKTSPDILICSLEQANILGRIASATLKNCTVVSFEHSTFYSKPYYYQLLKWTSPSVDAVLYDCEQTRCKMQAFYKTQDLPWLYTPLVSLNAAPEQHYYKTRKPFTILSVGRLVNAKNLSESIKAIKLLIDKGHKIQFNIAGVGSLEHELRELAKKLGIENNITFLGYVNNWQVLCESADIFLQTSLYEGLCIAVIEAMATGIPVVATNVGGMMDYGIDAENLLKTKGFSSGHIADAIELAINDENLRSNIGSNGKKDILQQFGKETVNIELNKTMSALLEISNTKML